MSSKLKINFSDYTIRMSKTSPEYNTIPCLLYVGAPTPPLIKRIAEIPEGTRPYDEYYDWAVTITVDPSRSVPVPKHYNSRGYVPYGKCFPGIQYEYLKLNILEELWSAEKNCNYNFRVNDAKFVFELTKSGALHAHGKVNCLFKTPVVLQVVHRQIEANLGRSLIEYLHGDTDWDQYMMKDQTDTQTDMFPILKIRGSDLNDEMMNEWYKERYDNIRELVKKPKKQILKRLNMI